MTPDTIISFGKYKGKTLKYVHFNDPSYYVWAVAYVSGFGCDELPIPTRRLLRIARSDANEGLIEYFDEQQMRDCMP